MTKKDAYYFSHDSNARNDDKVLLLRMKLGWEGYGIYWALIEKLREAKDYRCVKDYNIIAFDLRIDASKVKTVIEGFGLFVFTENGKYFYSESLNERMLSFDTAKEIAAINGIKGNLIKNKKATKSELDNMSNADIIRLNESFKGGRSGGGRDATAIREDKIREDNKKKSEGNKNIVDDFKEDSFKDVYSEISDAEIEKEYTENDLLINWTECRKHYLNKPTHIKKISSYDKVNFNKALLEYKADGIKTALFGLFKQENLTIASMTLQPKHFLENIDKYYQAEKSKEYKLYGSKPKLIEH